LIASPFTGTYMGRLGRKNMVVLGLFQTGLASLILASSIYFENKWAFYFTALIARVFQGAADAICSIACFSIANIEFDEQIMGFVVASLGLGLLLGPIISSVIFNWLGFAYTFVFFFFLLSLSALLA
jgi:MFS family permease